MAYIYNEKVKSATDITAAYNARLEEEWDEQLKLQERRDVENARKHIILPYSEDKWEKFGKRPDSVNPYLWQSRINAEFAGVYRMADDYYVVTGAAVSEIAFIKGKTGWVAIDTGANETEAAISTELAERASGETIRGNITALIITHTHYDHFGGAGYYVTEGKTVVYGPADYEQSLVDDNLYAGRAMSRRLVYQSGLELAGTDYEPQGCGVQKIFAGKGKAVTIIPDIFIDSEKSLLIDGIQFTFVPAPNTETRAHMTVYDNTHKVLALGDISMGTLHNTYTPRGARTRDAAFWGEIFYHLYNEFGDEAVAVFQGHGIPHFKSEDDPDNVSRYLLDNAAAYKFPNDEALLLANKGVKLQDIGRKINIPDRISKTWYTRDHYGNYTFNARGAVNRILGFYDGNPVNLWPLEETEYAARFVEYAGGEDEALKKAEQDFAGGDYQWVASVANYIVMSNPDNKKARYLGADALEQLAYQTQTGLWRNMYLTGAYELRNPDRKKNAPHLMDNSEVMPYVNAGLLFDYLGINFDGEKGIDLQEKFIIEITDTDDAEKYVVTLYKGTLLYDRLSGQKNTEKLTSVKLSRTQLYQLSSAKLGAEAFDGQTDDGRRIISLIQDNITDTAVYSDFNIIEPLAQ